MTRWTAQGADFFPLGDGRELAVSEITGASSVLPSADVDALLACGPLRSLAEHATELKLPAPPAFLEQAAADGLLLSDGKIVALARRRVRPAPPPPAALAIFTCRRPEALARCLAGFKAPELAVYDDGADAPAAVPPGVRYAGPAEKLRYLDLLAKEADVDPALAAFALGETGFAGFRAGGNRNAAFFDQIDRLYVAVDDDTVARFASTPEALPGQSLGFEQAPFESWSYPDRDAALRANPAVELDFLAAHAALLGRSPGAAAALEVESIGPGLLRRLRHEECFAAVTMSGLLGDGAMATASWLLTLDPRSRGRIAGSDAAWESAKASREVLRVARRPSFTDHATLLTYACGYDGRAVLPPFMPYGRNEDAAFVVALLRCVPGALIGHLPVAILHAPEAGRSYELAAGGGIGLGELLAACIGSLAAAPGIAGSDDAYHAVGGHLRDIAGMSDADYDEILRGLFWPRRCGRLSQIEKELKESPGCPARARDLARALETLLGSLLKPDFAVPKDVPGADAAAKRANAKAFLGRYGELLEAWPTLVAAARRLRSGGLRLSRP